MKRKTFLICVLVFATLLGGCGMKTKENNNKEMYTRELSLCCPARTSYRSERCFAAFRTSTLIGTIKEGDDRQRA